MQTGCGFFVNLVRGPFAIHKTLGLGPAPARGRVGRGPVGWLAARRRSIIRDSLTPPPSQQTMPVRSRLSCCDGFFVVNPLVAPDRQSGPSARHRQANTKEGRQTKKKEKQSRGGRAQTKARTRKAESGRHGRAARAKKNKRDRERETHKERKRPVSFKPYDAADLVQ